FLLQQAPDAIPSKVQVAKTLFPDAVFSDVKIRLLMSDLFKLLEQYLSHQSRIVDETSDKIQLASIYRKRKLPQHFQRTIKQVRQLQSKSRHRDSRYYNRLYQIQLEEYEFNSSINRTKELNLQTLSNTIDLSYLSEKLRLICLSLSHQSVYKANYAFGLINDLLAQIEQTHYLDIPAIAAYYYGIFLLNGTAQKKHFVQFKQLIFEQGHCFPKAEIRDLYLLAINHCIKKFNDGELHYVQEGLDLFKQGLEKDLLVENGVISRFSYNNIVAFGLRKKEYDWVEQFINQYKINLERKFRERTYSIAMARLQYERKAYTLALQYLQKAEYRDLLNNLIAKTLQLKIYFELGEFNLLESHLQTLKIFISRKKAMGYHQRNYLNLVRYTQKLLQVKPYDKTAKAKLRKAIQEEDILSEKKWLLQQLK
ncbi:MAG: hypothetical protein AAGD05_13215, partial [Bacteroidota bacterium]